MISKPLLKQSIKSNWLMWAVVTFAICLLIAIITISMSSQIDKILIPLNMQRAMNGLPPLADTEMLDKLIGSTFYGMVGTMLPLIYIIVTGNKLIASQVDRGSMAFILSTPTKRNTVSITQMVFFIISLFFMMFILCATALLTSYIGLGSVDVGNVVLLNFSLFITMVALSGIVFMFSCIFNLSKHSLGLGGGLTALFYLCKIIGQFGSPDAVAAGMGTESLKYFDYFTPISLFDVNGIISGSSDIYWKIAVLVFIAIATYTIGILKFNKKDLPL